MGGEVEIFKSKLNSASNAFLGREVVTFCKSREFMNNSQYSSLSLMTFNIAHGRGLSLYQGFHSHRGIFKNLDRIAKIIRDHQPDIVALQEIDESSHWNKHINLLNYLQSATEYPVAIHGIHNKRGGRKPLAYGNAFLSRHTVIDWEAASFGEKQLGEKGFLEARFNVGGTEIDVVNLHLDFRSRRTRIRQVEQLLTRLHNRSEGLANDLPPIICGDFNTSSRATRDALHHLIQGKANNEDYRYYPHRERTFPAHFPSRGLDFVLLADPFENETTEVVKCFASDHLPVVVKMRYPNKFPVGENSHLAASKVQ